MTITLEIIKSLLREKQDKKFYQNTLKSLRPLIINDINLVKKFKLVNGEGVNIRSLENREYSQKIKNLSDGSYKLRNGEFVKVDLKSGYMVEVNFFDEEQGLKKGEYLGVWKDEKGKQFIGLSKRIMNEEKAIILGQNTFHNYLEGEKAIWDCRNSAEIYLR